MFTLIYTRSVHWTPLSTLMPYIHIHSYISSMQFPNHIAESLHGTWQIMTGYLWLGSRFYLVDDRVPLFLRLDWYKFFSGLPFHKDLCFILGCQASRLVMLLALLLLQQLLIGLAGVNHESFVKADGFSAWIFFHPRPSPMSCKCYRMIWRLYFSATENGTTLCLTQPLNAVNKTRPTKISSIFFPISVTPNKKSHQVPSVENDGSIITSIALMQIKTNLGTSACRPWPWPQRCSQRCRWKL